MEFLPSDVIDILRRGLNDSSVIWVGGGWAESESIMEKFQCPLEVWYAVLASETVFHGEVIRRFEITGYGAYVRSLTRKNRVNALISPVPR